MVFISKVHFNKNIAEFYQVSSKFCQFCRWKRKPNNEKFERGKFSLEFLALKKKEEITFPGVSTQCLASMIENIRYCSSLAMITDTIS